MGKPAGRRSWTTKCAANYADLADYARRAGLINKPVQVERLFAPQFVAQALGQLKLQNYWAS